MTKLLMIVLLIALLISLYYNFRKASVNPNQRVLEVGKHAIKIKLEIPDRIMRTADQINSQDAMLPEVPGASAAAPQNIYYDVTVCQTNACPGAGGGGTKPNPHVKGKYIMVSDLLEYANIYAKIPGTPQMDSLAVSKEW